MEDAMTRPIPKNPRRNSLWNKENPKKTFFKNQWLISRKRWEMTRLSSIEN
jgi:hypothetical protein